MNKLFRTISQLGSLPVYLLFIVLLFFFDPSWLFVQLAFMILITTALVLVLKVVFNSNRPNYQERQSQKKSSNKGVLAHFRYIVYVARHRSFPSAHASRAAGLLIILALYVQQLHITILATLFCFLVSYARVVLSDHRLKDVLVGILIGLLAGYASYVLAELFVSWYFSSQPLLSEVVVLA